jgi:hypothetical protein
MDLMINDVLKARENGHFIRILWMVSEPKSICLFDMDTLAMPYWVSYTELQGQLDKGMLVIQDSDPFLPVVPEDYLSDSEKNFRDKLWELMSNIVLDEPTIFHKKGRGAVIEKAVRDTGKTMSTLHRYLKQYWKRGKTKNAFLPNYQNCGASGKERNSGDSKRGRPRKYDECSGRNVDEETKRIFEKAVKKYYHNRDGYSLKAAYELMIKEHYTKFAAQPNGTAKAELLPANEIPTIGQFRYWYGKKHDVREKIVGRKGESKFSLDHRALLGKSDYGLMGPGAKYQIDATVGDIYLVSRFNRADIIGRPVIYFVIDMFSRMVAGMYVGLEGPSWAGAMMAIANAASDKVKYCAEYGVAIADGEWPCRHMPNAILGDRGEMESKAAETLINALNVRVENAPPYRADMKGIVEQYFHTINTKAMAFLPGHVKPDMTERGGRDYRLDAKLDIRQLTKILIQCVLQHNNHHFLDGYERTADMIADSVEPIPAKLWGWGISHLSGALRSFPEETVKLCLMPTGTASVTAKGIRFNGLYYLCERAESEHWFETARAKGSYKVDVSYDPRNMGAIYVREPDGAFDACFLAEWQDKYTDMCLDEIRYQQESEKLLRRQNEAREMATKADLSAAIDSVVAEAEAMARQTAVPKSKLARTKDIRENRRAEKERSRREEAFSLGSDVPPPTPDSAETPKNRAAISPTLAMIQQQLEERLNEK